ncbi:MAG: M14 family metallopeptidase [Spirosomataceae bacterium]
MKLIALFLWCMVVTNAFSQDLTTVFERTKGAETVTYQEGMAYYQILDKKFPQIQLKTMGMTDSGFPLHVAILSPEGDFNLESLRKKNKRLVFINNGIHPGEPDGIDASMMLLRDYATGKIKLPANVVLAVVPFYNIGGTLNRSPYSRINQNGPNAYGFRANARNYDLNRDFIKADSKNARSFAEIFHWVDPDVQIDNHVSNGADYQHVMTLVSTQHSKLDGQLGVFFHDEFSPALHQKMKQWGWDLVPYVNAFGPNPERGFDAFMDGPRYSSGYASLFQTLSFMPETHMLKPYTQRVQSTYDIMRAIIELTSQWSDKIKTLKAQAREEVKQKQEFPLSWVKDTTRLDMVTFKGYESGYKPSDVSGLPRLYYDRNKPFEKQISYYNYFKPSNVIKKPKAYLIPQGWHNVIELLKVNGVQMTRFPKDSTIEVEVYRIEDFKSAPRPYEGHHPNSDVKVSVSTQKIMFRQGDYYIPMNQIKNRYLIETLEPTGGDSFFSWNFFDTILQQKEGYSSYVFEDVAAEYLRQHPALKTQLDKKKAEDEKFAKSGTAQLDFVFKNSPYYEPDHNRYPVYRLVK